jgi:hypothetical protein
MRPSGSYSFPAVCTSRAPNGPQAVLTTASGIPLPTEVSQPERCLSERASGPTLPTSQPGRRTPYHPPSYSTPRAPQVRALVFRVLTLNHKP